MSRNKQLSTQVQMSIPSEHYQKMHLRELETRDQPAAHHLVATTTIEVTTEATLVEISVAEVASILVEI
jgi:hypothetical protein